MRASSAGPPTSTGTMTPPAGSGPPHTPISLRGGLSPIGQELLRQLSPTSEAMQVMFPSEIVDTVHNVIRHVSKITKSASCPRNPSCLRIILWSISPGMVVVDCVIFKPFTQFTCKNMSSMWYCPHYRWGICNPSIDTLSLQGMANGPPRAMSIGGANVLNLPE